VNARWQRIRNETGASVVEVDGHFPSVDVRRAENGTGPRHVVSVGVGESHFCNTSAGVLFIERVQISILARVD
jgi:hypothetical protein